MNQHAIKSGVTVGAVNITIILLIYLLQPSMIVSMWMLLLFFVILGLAIYFGLQYRKLQGGFLSFKIAWIHSFLLFVVAGFIGTLFNILLYHVIDPELPEILTEQAIENTASMMERFGLPEDGVDEALEQTRESTLSRFSIEGNLKGFLWNLLSGTVLSLIVGAVVKKKNTEL